MTPNEGDGRNIDARVGTLSGEAAEQRVPANRAASQGTVPYTVWEKSPSEDGSSYYDRPVLKEPVWVWAVPAYFYAGGAAGAAALLSSAARRLGDGEMSGLVANGRRLAAAGGAAGTALLIYDLGRPERFLNMLRVFRPTSPMNLGSWILSADAPLMAGSVLFGESLLGNLSGDLAALLGVPLAGYTAVLLSNTAVPAWQGARRSLPALFLSSAVASAASLLEMASLNPTEARVVRRFGIIGQLAELASSLMLEKELSDAPRVAASYEEGLAGSLWRAAKLLTVSSLAVSLLPGASRKKRIVAGALGTAGALAVKFSVFHAGKHSTRDPKATFEPQRAALNA